MDFESLLKLTGTWKGKYTLWKSPDDFPEITESLMTVKSALLKKFLIFDYTWAVDNHPQEGSLKLGFESKRSLFSAFWIDTWHMGEKFMTCQGFIDEFNSLVLRGFYEVSSGPDWGWKTVIENEGESLRITMYNVTPEGNDQLAVKAVYKKQ